MRHYLGNSGADLTIRLQNMVDESAGAKKNFYIELNEAMAFCETIQDRWNFEIMSSAWSTGYNSKKDSMNWYYAVGGFSAHGSGPGRRLDDCTYLLHFHYYFFDRYNWDKGKSVKIGPIRVPDVKLGRLHELGLAQEFNMFGFIKKTVQWTKGQRFDPKTGRLLDAPVDKPADGGGRQDR